MPPAPKTPALPVVRSQPNLQRRHPLVATRTPLHDSTRVIQRSASKAIDDVRRPDARQLLDNLLSYPAAKIG